MRKLTRILLTVVLIAAAGCDTGNTLPTATPGGGFLLQTLVNENGILFVEPGVTIIGTWVADLPGAAGDPSKWTRISSAEGLISVVGGRAPATWDGLWVSDSGPGGPGNVCDGRTARGNVAVNALSYITCSFATGLPQAVISPFTLSPNLISTTTPPSSVSVTGQGLSTTYGMPLIQYYNPDGTLIAQENASSVSSSTSMVASGGGISSLPAGTYAGYVFDAGPNSTWNYVGAGILEVANGWVTISGAERQKKADCAQYNPKTGDCIKWDWIYDTGTVSITVNGVTVSASYGQGSTASSIALALTNAINTNTSINTLVAATAWPTQVIINVTHSGSQYSLSATATSNDTSDFPGGSFSTNPSAPML